VTTRSMTARGMVFVLAIGIGTAAVAGQGRGGAPQGRGGGPPPTPKTAALADLTGTWVALVTEDWRYRMFAAPKGDYASMPLNPAGRKFADAWDPAKDEAAGEQCKAYGAGGLMRMPTRLRITWQDDTTLKVESEAGTQTRLLRFTAPQGGGAAKDEAGGWQGVSAASWDYPRATFPARGAAPPPNAGAMKVVTTQMRPGYLRRNGVPYSANAVMTEYFNRIDVPGGDALLLVVAEIVDPEYLATPYWTSTQFKRQTDASGWSPTPCAAR
jgi:hypothetical protein